MTKIYTTPIKHAPHNTVYGRLVCGRVRPYVWRDPVKCMDRAKELREVWHIDAHAFGCDPYYIQINLNPDGTAREWQPHGQARGR